MRFSKQALSPRPDSYTVSRLLFHAPHRLHEHRHLSARRHPPINQDGSVARGIQPDIGWLHIAVNVAARVSMPQSDEHVSIKAARVCLGERARGLRVHMLLQVGT